MRVVPEGSVTEPLLERGDELERIAFALDAAQQSHGGLTLIEGGVGTGKTSLVGAAGRMAEASGFGVLRARGSELEADFGFGVVRQLFERSILSRPPARRGRLLRGAAALASPALGLAPAQQGEGAFAALHGVYWLLTELAEERPLVLMVDDAQWADLDSLRCLDYVANRIDEMPVSLIVARRPLLDEDPRGPLAGFASTAPLLELGPLGPESVGKLAEGRLDMDPAPEFVTACHRATGGNPLAVTEVLRELAAREARPSAEVAATLEDRAPPRLARGVQVRVKQAGRPAEQLARALSVLGDGVELQAAAALAELDADTASVAADALAEHEVVAPERPLRFLHPLIRSAIYDGIAPGARSRAHRSAASLVASGPGGADAAAVHLLAVDPAGDPEVVEQLSLAAGRAIQAGAPGAAASYLRRALAEPAPPERHGAVLRYLGLAEVASSRPQGLDHLREAQAGAGDPLAKAAIAGELCGALAYFGDWQAAIDTAREALGALGDSDHPIAMGLGAAVASLEWQDAHSVQRFEESLPRLRRLVDSGGRPARALALILAAALAGRGVTAEAIALTEQGLDEGRLIREEPSERLEAAQAVNALIWSEHLDDGVRVATEIIDEAGRRGSVPGIIAGSIQRGLGRLRCGDLAEAEADLLLAEGLACEYGVTAPMPFALAYLAQVMVERGGAGELRGRLDEFPHGLVTSALLTLQHARGVVRLAEGDRAGGIEDLRAVGVHAEQLGTLSPGVLPWRAQLADALAEHAPDESRALAEEDLRRARDAGLLAAEGIALRSLALTATGKARIAKLEESASALERSFGRLEHARTLTELGAALRAQDRQEEARPVLLQALDLAHRCGAWPLGERARTEAVAAGARPRRPFLTGVQALTPSELRIVRLAAEGQSNREIAQSLFITKKTVADHLRAAYRKVGVSRREELPTALTEAGTRPRSSVSMSAGSSNTSP